MQLTVTHGEKQAVVDLTGVTTVGEVRGKLSEKFDLPRDCQVLFVEEDAHCFVRPEYADDEKVEVGSWKAAAKLVSLKQAWAAVHKGDPFYQLPEWVHGDKTMVREAIKHNVRALSHASDELRRDPEVVLEAVALFGNALEYADPALRESKEFMLQAVEKNVHCLVHASEELRADPEVVAKAVRTYGTAFEYASPKLQADKTFVGHAAKLCPVVLRYAAEELRNDADFVLSLVPANAAVVLHAGSELVDNVDFLARASKANEHALDLVCSKLRAKVHAAVEAATAA